ncbi:MAG: FecR domain-containing protein [Bacteroidota bacterium]
MEFDAPTYDLIDRYLAGELSGEELQAFEGRLANEPELAREVVVVREIAETMQDAEVMAFEQQLKSIRVKIDVGAGVDTSSDTGSSSDASSDSDSSSNSEDETPVLPMRRNWTRPIAIAASIILLAALTVIFLNQGGSSERDTNWAAGPRSETKTLTDGSQVTLAPNSTLAYNKAFSDDKRELQLEGAARFEVQRDPKRPFSVDMNGVTATVLGTSFSLRAFPGEDTTWLEVYTGKVAFEPEGKGERRVLTANQTAGWTKEGGIFFARGLRLPDPETGQAPRKTFDNAPLRDVTTFVGRYYGVRVNVEDGIARCPVSGTFPKIDAAKDLGAIAFAAGLDLENQGDTLYTLTGTCQ